VTQFLQETPPVVADSIVSFDGSDPAVIATVRRLRSRGADDNTVRLCLGMSLLDQIIAENRGRKKHLFCAGFAKSGTTYLHKLLQQATGFVDYLIDRFSEDQQQNIIRQWIPMFLAQDTVTQIHLFATRPNTRMLSELGITPVVVVRNLADALISLRDHILREDYVVPMAQVPASFRKWSQDDQLWFMARMVAPWYLNFFASWQRASADLNVLWITYNEVVSDTHETICRVLRHNGIDPDHDRIQRAIESIDLQSVRFNVGVSGRGAQLFSKEQQRAIADIAATFRGNCDFSIIGL
jgi:hypothetical protein